jgi:hypothetical protein
MKRSGQWHNYENQNLAAVIAICCTRAFFGYDCNLPLQFTMRQFRTDNHANPEIRLWFANTVTRLLDYIIKWVNVNPNVTFELIEGMNIPDVEQRIKKNVRCQKGMFSNSYLLSNGGRINCQYSPVVSGHMYEWALIFDLIIPNFRQKLNSQLFFLSPSQLQGPFDENDGNRLYKE